MELDVGELYREWGPMVFRRILRFYDEQEAEEVLHEVFVKVLENADRFRADASPSTWLYRIATNHCLNRLRDARRRQELWVEHGDAMFPTRTSPNSDEAILLRQVWRKLPDELVQIAVYYHLDGMTHAEIARIMGVSRRTVGNRLEELTRRAREAATDATSDEAAT